MNNLISYFTIFAQAGLERSRCFHIENSNKNCLMPTTMDKKPISGATEVVTTKGLCHTDWTLFCHTSEGYIRHYTSGMCFQRIDDFSSYLIVLTDECRTKFKELPHRAGIVDERGACVVPLLSRNDPYYLEKPPLNTPIRVMHPDFCEDMSKAQFFFNRG